MKLAGRLKILKKSLIVICRLAGLVFLSLVISFFILLIFFPTSDLRQVISKDSSKHLLRELPAHLLVAVVTAEDEKFFAHNGVDLNEIYNSVSDWLYQGKNIRGASTITQQVVKNNLLNKEKSYARKLVEIAGSMKVDFEYDKAEILLVYLELAEFGLNLSGIRRASKFYFNLEPQSLSSIQSVFLSSMLPAPSILSDRASCFRIDEHFKKLWYRVGTATLVAMDTPILSRRTRNAFEAAQILEGESIANLRYNLANNPKAALNILYLSKEPDLVMQLAWLADQFSEQALQLPCMERAVALMRSANDWAALSRNSG